MNLHIKADSAAEEDEREDGLASFNSRAAALIIDSVLMSGLLIGVASILPIAFGWLVFFVYLITRDSLPFLGGQSIGKMAMKIKAVTLDGKSLAGNWQAGAIRNGVLAIPLFVLVEIYLLLSREDKPDHGKRLGDEWARTKVIVIKPPVAQDEPAN